MNIGVLGGGQLGMMLGDAAAGLGVNCWFVDPAPAPPAAAAGSVLDAAYDDVGALRQLAAGVDVVTYEFENVPLAAVHALEGQGVEVLPPGEALQVAQDRDREKRFFASLGVATAPFACVSTSADFDAAGRATGFPAILKTRREGYDGKGQRRVARASALAQAFGELDEVPCVLEGFVPFDRELSILAVRGRDGETRCWPVVENHHHRGILSWSLCPAPNVSRATEARAQDIAKRLMEALNYVGVLCVELFDVGGELMANEFAPRVHNSGHWSIEGARTSQFENHMRAVTGRPLGATDVSRPTACVNVLGADPLLDAVQALSPSGVHMYGKSARKGRKLGHITFQEDDHATLQRKIDALLQAVPHVL